MRDIIASLLGRSHAGEVVTVTARGVELPLATAHTDWTLAQLSRLCAQIDRLPETEERS